MNPIEFDPATGHRSRWRILAIMCLCLVLVVAGISSLNLAIPSIIVALEPSATQTLWIIDAYALVFAGLLLPAGAIGDRYGRKGALLVGLAVFVAAALWAAWSGDPTRLIVARAAMGIGAALVMPATLSIIISVFSAQERPKAIAVWAGFAGAGGAMGVIGGGVLLEFFWWGSVFFVNVPLALLAGGLIAATVPTSRDDQETPLDPVGSVLSIAGLGALVYAIIEGGDAGWLAGSTIGFFVAAAVLLTGWIRWESATENPMLDPAYFSRAPFNMGSLTITGIFGVMFAMFFVITQYFQFVLGLSPLGAGVRTLPVAATMIAVAPRSPKLAARLGAGRAIALGVAVQAVGFAVMALSGVDTPYGRTVVGMILVAAGMGIAMPPASEAIVSSVPERKAGVASAWNDTTREVGGALGIAVLGTLLSVGYRSGISDAVESLPPEMAGFADLVEEGIGPAFQVAERAGLVQLVDPARAAFVDGMSLAFWVAAGFGVALAAAVFTRYSTPKPG